MIEANASKKQLILKIRQLSGDKTDYGEQSLQKSSLKPIEDIEHSPASHGDISEAFKFNNAQQFKNPLEQTFLEISVDAELHAKTIPQQTQEKQSIILNTQKIDELPDCKTSIDCQRQPNTHETTLELRGMTQIETMNLRNTVLIDLKNAHNEYEEEEGESRQNHQNPDKINTNEDRSFDIEKIRKSQKNYTTTKSSLNSSSSSIQLEDYFKQDGTKRKDEQMRNILMDITKFTSYYIRIRMGIFLEFFIAHLLFFMVLGPLSNPIIYKMGKSLPRNLMFWGSTQIFLSQTVFYVFFLLAVGLFAAFRTPFVFLQSEIIYLALGIFYRIFTISVKYSTFDPVKIKALKEHTFEGKELESDFFLHDWRDQTDRIIFEEIYFAQRMYDIDTSWMYIEFMLSPEKQTIQKIDKNNQILSAFHKQTNTPFMPTPITTTSPQNPPFYAYGIIKLLVDTFQHENQFNIKHAETVAKIYAYARSLTPTIYKIAHYQSSYFTDSCWYEWVISFLVFYLQYHFYFYTLWTLIQGVIDLKRKIFFMEQMAFMISPRKLRNLDLDKILPTINIFKSNNLKAWQLMRHVCQEYGKRYDIRVQANFTGLAIIMLVSVVVLVLSYFEVLSLEPSFLIILIVETAGVMIIVLQILYYGAKINSQFDLHDSILNSNKAILMDIYRMRRRYFCQQFKTQNYLYAKAVSKIKEDVVLLNLENPCAHIKEIVDSYGSHIDELKFDKNQNPFKIGSIKITNGMLESGIIGIVSVMIAVVSKYLSARIGG